MKRMISFILCFVFSMGVALFPSFAVQAQGGEWRLTDTINYDGKESVDAMNANGVYFATSSSAPGSYSYTWKYLGDTDTYYDPDLLNGENGGAICTFSTPPSTIQGGETVSLSLSLQFGAQMLSYFGDSAGAAADFDEWETQPGFVTDQNISFKNSADKDYFEINTYPSVNILSVSETLTAIAPIGTEEGEKIAVRTMFYGQKQGTCYIYEWFMDASAVAGTGEQEESTQDPLNTDGIKGVVDTEETTGEETEEEIIPEETEESGKITQIIDSDASINAGETSTNIIRKIVIGTLVSVVVAGVGAAAAGSATSSGGETSEENQESSGSSYRMAIYKDFGDKIKKNGQAVFVYARLIEVNKEGVEIERPDLTQQIEIFSLDGLLDIGAADMAGEYKGAAVQYYGSENDAAQEAKISFRFVGEGGVFQNNMAFILIGEARIDLENTQVFLLEGSGKSMELKYQLIDFTMEPKVTLEITREGAAFELETGLNTKGEKVVIIKDKGEKTPFDTFFQSYHCEMTAESEKETVKNRFYVEMCKEGIQADFLGKPNEIRGYRKNVDQEEMEETLFDIKVGVWIEEKKTLEFIKADQIEITLSDERNIFEIIGTQINQDETSTLTDRTRYIAKAKINFPSTQTISGKLHMATVYGNETIDNEIEIALVPDILAYENSKEKEYLACKRVIEVYMASRFRVKKLQELERNRQELGLEDLREFRKNCWSIAERSIMQERQEYLIDEAWYDEAIAYADVLVFIGDIAFDLALAPIGGPITGFIASQVKTAFIEVCEIYNTNPNKSIGELAIDFASKRLEVVAGGADGLIKMPEKDNPKALAAWLTTYVIYRIGYHKYYDVDESNESISIIEAVKRGLMDFVGKGAGILLGDFIKAQGKGRWVEKISVADKDEKLVNDNVEKALKTSLDTLDKGADKADEIVSEVLDTLLEYLHKLKITG